MPKPVEDWQDDLSAAVAALQAKAPADLLKRVNIDREDDEVVTDDDLVHLLRTHDQRQNAAVRALALALADWDYAQDPSWDAGRRTQPRTVERRDLVYRLLRVSNDVAEAMTASAAVATIRHTTVGLRWEPWYTRQRQYDMAFYWPHYKSYLLEQKGWNAESVTALDLATTEVVQRLSDPSAQDSYQSKGLVVGHVQSGKTANFTGVIAKAVDAGYRLVIILTGTIELLRSQTQRRLDRELVGRENLTRGLADGGAAEEFDYADDKDWLDGKFVSHGPDFSTRGYPGIERMTLLHRDYMRLQHGRSRLRLHLRRPELPFYDPENLLPADVQLFVVKKERNALQKLIQDLKPLRDKLKEIPALIIDDESDLASINTKNPVKKPGERTRINKGITDLLRHLQRGQLVMYTATPFANFFVDPDADDIFPKNFIVTLDPPPDYMGVQEFHDVGWNTEDDKDDPATSNERAFVRPVGPPPDSEEPADRGQREAEMLTALDSFVLAGAVKVYREDNGQPPYRHHTMLVHESTGTDKHSEQAALVRQVWKTARYDRPEAARRLRRLWDEDYGPVCRARADGFPVPASFDALVDALGEARRRIEEVGDPVLVVNSDQDVQKHQQDLDFDRNDVWRVLVGGAKLSRGFTVEGLTISFYTRKALQADTLMQAGRWFGYRRGFKDLVRLFIRRDPDGPHRVDLYEAFEGLMRDEVAMREQLKEYEGFDDEGHPIVEPWQVPPLVSQHLPYLRPTARNKMFNAYVDSSGDAGKLRDLYGLTSRDDVQGKRNNYRLVRPMLTALTDTRTFVAARRKPEDPPSTFEARTGTVKATEFVDVLEKLAWELDEWENRLRPMIRFYRGLIEDGRLEDVVLLWPQLTRRVIERDLPGLPGAQIVTRKRRMPPRREFVGSDAKHRATPTGIAGADLADVDPQAAALRDGDGRRAAALIYLAADIRDRGDGPSPAADLPQEPDPADIATLISLAAPVTATPHGRSVIQWSVRREAARGDAVVPLE
ncbi:Z1 domain-containing protein [Mangrovihabitans endophyticus]|uniref:Putative endonuclease Z1 domain-containing protein n=1 Tax=Mangrovihabitans endophyticus TaxID=1751298 RepID=A0A8J3FPP5_9ACTN|nr:Z1 domain-containing protein [Mangrovihabitans endophyticus]GGK94393.1 hypothetical protein GCM10012284_30530 [Mangrovihabitans endophyticus]